MFTVRHVATVRRRLREEAPSAGVEGGARAAASRSGRFKTDAPLSSAIAPGRQGFTTDGTGVFNAKAQGRKAARAGQPHVKFMGQIFAPSCLCAFALNSFWLRLCRTGSWRLLPRNLSGLTVEMSFLSLKSVQSVVPFLWSKLATLGLLRLIAKNQWKCLSMSLLRQKTSFS